MTRRRTKPLPDWMRPPAAPCLFRPAAASPLLFALAACALVAPPVDDVLSRRGTASAPSSPASSQRLSERGASLQAELDALVKDALAAARATGDAASAARAARVLFETADLRVQRAALAWVEAADRPSCRDVLAAEDHVADDVRMEVLGLCTAGEAHARQVLAQLPDNVQGELYLALHLSLIAWANGPVRSLVAGYGPKITAAIDRAVMLDAAFDHAAPLRLRGRFLGKAPWPYGDLPKARESLEKALAAADLTVHRLFLGDVLWNAGDHDAARAEWERASRSGDDGGTRWSGPFFRELARARVSAADRER